MELTRDPDVLDTWFSSASLAVLDPGLARGDAGTQARYYPTDVLVTGFDIIFFWVARMMMLGLHFMDEVPFHTVYIHALVRDERGKKMSKSLGNVMDPLELIDQYGADALRFTLTAMAAQGRDIKLSAGRIEGYRNFVTKLWNAARYAEMNGCAPTDGFDPSACKLTVNRWIVGELAHTESAIELALEDYRFNEAASAIYQFTWHTFCDWYLEFTKPILTSNEPGAAEETRATTAWVLDQLLHLMHPFMPYVTEELWEKLAPLGKKRPTALISSDWPNIGPELQNAAAKAEMDWVVRVISEVRAVRAELNVPAGAKPKMLIKDAGDETLARVETHREIILRIARLDAIEPAGAKLPPGSVQAVVDEATLILPLGDIIDIEQEKERLKNEIGKKDSDIGKSEKKLANENFVSRAPEEVVEEQRERLAEMKQERQKLAEAVERLSAT